MIGGNVTAVMQRQTGSELNPIGERVSAWQDVLSIVGFLDLSTGDSRYTHDAKIAESSHIFIADYTPLDQNPADKRLVVEGVAYDVLWIDDPMGLHQHLEIYLKRVG